MEGYKAVCLMSKPCKCEHKVSSSTLHNSVPSSERGEICVWRYLNKDPAIIVSFLLIFNYYCPLKIVWLIVSLFISGFSTNPVFIKRFYLFIFRQKGREGEREGEKQQCVVGTWPATQACALTGNRTSNPLVHRPIHWATPARVQFF